MTPPETHTFVGPEPAVNGHAVAAPAVTADGRDRGGRFVAGAWRGGPGRSRGIDIRHTAEEFAAAEGIDLREALWKVIKGLLSAAEKGDTQAAKLLLDRLTDCDPLALRVVTDNGGMSDVDLRARVHQILIAAEVRELCGE
jgi:hypothetical protein